VLGRIGTWTPPPQDFEHLEKSETFHLGGHGWSLHVLTMTSGLSVARQFIGFTGLPSSVSTQMIFDSWRPR
jgi:hypothetical protein